MAAALATVLATLAACGSDATDDGASDATSTRPRPHVVVTTNILGDIVAAAVGDHAEVDVVMPLGANPHDFGASAQQAEMMENADLLISNGAGFEAGMLDVIDNVSDSGTKVFSFADHIELLAFSDEEEHADEEEPAGEEDHDEGDDGNDHKGGDPHLWTDPTRVATSLAALEPVVAALDGVDPDALSASFDAYLTELSALDTSIDQSLAVIPAERRVLVTNHEVFGYFADRYDFDVVGAVIPSLTTNAEPSAAEIEALAELIETEDIPAVFGETTQSTQLAEALAGVVGGEVAVVELFSESLGDEGSGAETYVDMMNLNARLISQALAG